MKDRPVTEVKLMEAEFSFGLNRQLDHNIPDTLFEDLDKFMKHHCHLLSEVFKTLIMGRGWLESMDLWIMDHGSWIMSNSAI